MMPQRWCRITNKNKNFVNMILLVVSVIVTVATNTAASRAHFMNSGDCHYKGRWMCEDETRNDHTNSMFRRKNCYCDQMCTLFNDCCFDYINKHKYLKTNLDVSSFSCEFVPQIFDLEPIYIVKRCPISFTGHSIRALCEEESLDILLTIPVSGRQSTVTFRNMYCAQCHQEDYAMWNPMISCQDKGPEVLKQNMSFVDLLRDPYCEHHFVPPGNFSYRQCVAYDATCPENVTDARARDKCTNGQFGVLFSDTSAYRNMDCAECNSVNTSSLMCRRAVSGIHSLRRQFYPFSILFDMNSRSGSATVGFREFEKTVVLEEYVSCEESEVYDPFISKCRTVHCFTGYSYNGMVCVQATENNRSADIAVYDCPVIALNVSEYDQINDTHIFVHAANMSYDDTRYHLENDVVYLCVNFTQNYTITTVEQQRQVMFYSTLTESYVSFIGMLLSVSGLVLYIVIYLSYPSLHNEPGKNMLALVISLLLANVAFLVAPSCRVDASLCTTIAISMHYFFLTSFFWMNVISFDVWFTFARNSIRDLDKSSSTRFIAYATYAMCSPLIIVGAASTVNYAYPDAVSNPGYGNGICWISRKDGLLVFFAGPASMLLMANLFFYIMAARGIYLAKQSAKNILSNNDKWQVLIYLKLYIIMGMTWIFGFLPIFTTLRSLWYVFIVLNSLQGLFIFLSFIFTKKVYRLLSERCRYLSRTCSFRDTKRMSGSVQSLATRVTMLPSYDRQTSNPAAKRTPIPVYGRQSSSALLSHKI